jgi:hypothetical protein
MTDTTKFTVRCTLPNAASEISGTAFTEQDDGSWVSEPINADEAERLASINGYEIVWDDQKAEADENARLLAEAAELGVKVDGRWSNTKLAEAVSLERDRQAAEVAAKAKLAAKTQTPAA